MRKSRRAFSTPREGVAQDGAIRYRAAQRDCEVCALKPKCCPNMLARKRILRLGRLRLRGPDGAKDEFLLAATAQNLRKLAKLIPLPAPIFAT